MPAGKASFKKGEPVWAHIDGFPWWPARCTTREEIVLDADEPEPEVAANEMLVTFFNDNGRFAPIPISDMRPFATRRFRRGNKNYNGHYEQDLEGAFDEAMSYAVEHGWIGESGAGEKIVAPSELLEANRARQGQSQEVTEKPETDAKAVDAANFPAPAKGTHAKGVDTTSSSMLAEFYAWGKPTVNKPAESNPTAINTMGTNAAGKHVASKNGAGKDNAGLNVVDAKPAESNFAAKSAVGDREEGKSASHAGGKATLGIVQASKGHAKPAMEGKAAAGAAGGPKVSFGGKRPIGTEMDDIDRVVTPDISSITASGVETEVTPIAKVPEKGEEAGKGDSAKDGKTAGTVPTGAKGKQPSEHINPPLRQASMGQGMPWRGLRTMRARRMQIEQPAATQQADAQAKGGESKQVFSRMSRKRQKMNEGVANGHTEEGGPDFVLPRPPSLFDKPGSSSGDRITAGMRLISTPGADGTDRAEVILKVEEEKRRAAYRMLTREQLVELVQARDAEIRCYFDQLEVMRANVPHHERGVETKAEKAAGKP